MGSFRVRQEQGTQRIPAQCNAPFLVPLAMHDNRATVTVATLVVGRFGMANDQIYPALPDVKSARWLSTHLSASSPRDMPQPVAHIPASSRPGDAGTR